MGLFDSLYKAECERGERTAYFIRWLMIVFMAVMAVIQLLNPDQSRAGIWAGVTIILAAVYNLYLSFRLKQTSGFKVLRYVSVSVDILLVSFTILTTTLFLHPSGASTSAIVFIYPIVILVASFRHDRALIVYATLFSIACFNAVYWLTLPAVSPELFAAAPLAKPIVQFYKSMYLLFFGIVLLQVPRTIGRLLKSQQSAFDEATRKYAAFAERLRSSLASLDGQCAGLAGEIQKTSHAIRDIVALTDESTQRVADQGTSVNQVAELIEAPEAFAGGLENLVGDQAAAIRETAAATEEMIGNIASISRHVEQTKTGVEKLQGDSDEGKTRLAEVGVSIESLEGVQQVADYMTEIENAMPEQAAGSRQISGAMSGMHDATNKVRDRAASLRERSEGLRFAVEELKSQNRAVSGELESVTSRVGEIDEVAGVGTEVRSFKLVEVA